MVLSKYFAILRKNWYGSIIVFAILWGIIFGALKVAIIEPLDIPDNFAQKQIPHLFLVRFFWQVFASSFLGAISTILIDLIFKKKNSVEHAALTSYDKANKERLNVLKQVGITNASAKLDESKYVPRECMRVSKRNLYFMGISGAKWINEPGNAFENFLRRIEGVSGKVFFLLIDPSHEGFTHFNTMRNNNVESHSDLLASFYRFSQMYNCLEVRLYSSLPKYRSICIDEKEIIVSPYRFDQDAYLASNKGWDNPHVAFDADAPWSFYSMFEDNFFHIWKQSKELKTYMSEQSDKESKK